MGVISCKIMNSGSVMEKGEEKILKLEKLWGVSFVHNKGNSYHMGCQFVNENKVSEGFPLDGKGIKGYDLHSTNIMSNEDNFKQSMDDTASDQGSDFGHLSVKSNQEDRVNNKVKISQVTDVSFEEKQEKE